MSSWLPLCSPKVRPEMRAQLCVSESSWQEWGWAGGHLEEGQ